MAKLIGKSLPRLEDGRLVSGNGRFSDDIRGSSPYAAVFLRSPYAHARIRRIDVTAAQALPGVKSVLTANDYREDGHRPLHHHVNGPDAVDITRLAFVESVESPIFHQAQAPLAEDRVRFVGEIVCIVVAETAMEALDAAQSVDVEYEELQPVVTPTQATASDAPQLWPDAPNNTCFVQTFGDQVATDRAFKKAAFVVGHDFKYQRIVACQMEPRSATGQYDAVTGNYLLVSGSQGVMRHRACLADALGVDVSKVRVVTNDVGGGFGSRTSLNPEAVLVCWVSRRVGRAVRWRGDRTEFFVGDYQGRDMEMRAALALDASGKILAVKSEYVGNVGAHTVSFVPLANGFRLISTVYHIPVGTADIRAVLTNTVPTAPYRGAGRPETTYIIERLLDIAARRHGFDRIELRKRNIVRKAQLPYVNVMGLTYDSGDFPANMDSALSLAGWKTFPERRAVSRMKGFLRGIGVANYVESPVGAVNERVEVTLFPDGTVEIVSGTQSTGQGHETVFAQVAGDQLAVGIDKVRLVTGDTHRIQSGGGTHSDRTMRLGGMLIVEACEKIVEQARTIAARALNIEKAHLQFDDGVFSLPASNQTLSLLELISMGGEPLSAIAEIARRVPAHPTGCAICEVEVDPETGTVSVVDYASVDDVGQPINPMIVDGQVHGGIAMGIGEALSECFSVDAETGQVMSASFMDYAVSHASDLPAFRIALVEDRTFGNPLHVKGGGECGITPAAAAVVNAILDALTEFGVENIQLPATPERVWRAIHDAKIASVRSDGNGCAMTFGIAERSSESLKSAI